MEAKDNKKPISGNEEERLLSASSRTASQRSSPKTIDAKTKRACEHVHKGVNPEILSYKLKSSEPVECEICRKRQASKGKAKQENKDGGAESISGCRAIWICLKCGDYSCGGILHAAIPQSHALLHAVAFKHPLAMQYEFPPLLCCFLCEILVRGENLKDILLRDVIFRTIMRMIKVRLFGTPTLEEEEFWLGRGSVTSSVISETCPAVGLGGRVGYRVRGMLNLGNTCFLNAILQNLLALDTLRDNFCKLDGSLGPLTAALKEIFLETQPDVSRNVIDPTSLLNSVCEKAPHFRGYQQQDSHELLRYLLDGLIQELNARKQNKSSLEDGNSDLTFVDAIFGGQFSSTITCMQCGHLSILYEPFLDISLPIEKPRPKQYPVTQAKKPGTIPRQHAMICPKISRDTNTQPSPSTSDQSAVCFEDSALVDTDSSIMAESKSLSLHSLSSIQHAEWQMPQNRIGLELFEIYLTVKLLVWYMKYFPKKSTQHAESNQSIQNVVEKPTQADDLIRLAFHKAFKVAMNVDVTSQIALPENPFDFTGDEYARLYAIQNDTELNTNSESSGRNMSTCTDAAYSSYDRSSLDIRKQEKLLVAHDLGLPINEISVLNKPKPAVRNMEPLFVNKTKANQVVQAGFRRKSIESQVDDNTDPPPSVETCLSYFTKREILLKNEHAWQCEKCSEVLQEQRMIFRKEVHSPISRNVHKEEFRSGTHSEGTDDKEESSQIVKVERTAQKRSLIHRAPSILTIHLKRFRQDAKGYLQKMDDYVQFNPTIDLKPYMDPRCTGSDKYEYHLVGVVEHAGTALGGGHYVSYVRGGTKITENGNEECVWFHATDGIVSEVPLEKVLACRAYILFYKRI